MAFLINDHLRREQLAQPAAWSALPYHYLHPLALAALAGRGEEAGEPKINAPLDLTSKGSPPSPSSSGFSEASSTSPRRLRSTLSDWSVEEVADFVANVEGCSQFAEVRNERFKNNLPILFVRFWALLLLPPSSNQRFFSNRQKF